ncbi:MAG: hypothetical protein A2Y24_05245 [Clostridiales bacterium GWE2_32_10]|nr:MAG: hypothetical protein A2Y24_05245 [Clostridiales bacterium GWE2_32_10]
MAFSARELFARLIKCEAGGEGDNGMKAVATSVMNRVHVSESLPTQEQKLPIASPIPREQTPQILKGIYYIPGFLKTQIGKMLRVEFLVGSTGPLVDRIGTLLSVGASYILLRPIGTDDTLLCDIYSIKFVTVYSTPFSLEQTT